MTYFGFLLWFLIIPIILLLAVTIFDHRRGLQLPPSMRAFPAAAAVLLHALIALLYTTLWDNYLVASKVWWYDPALVTGITIGWVPIEEYTFIALQPVLAILAALLVGRHLKIDTVGRDRPAIRLTATLALFALWHGVHML